jgi:hypothetical protein
LVAQKKPEARAECEDKEGKNEMRHLQQAESGAIRFPK